MNDPNIQEEQEIPEVKLEERESPGIIMKSPLTTPMHETPTIYSINSNKNPLSPTNRDITQKIED